MEFLDLVKIGSTVKVNVNLSKDRLNAKTLELIKESQTCLVKDFRLTDGKGIGVVVEFINGQKEWFFENEIEILDNEGKVLERNDSSDKNKFFLIALLESIKYSPKKKLKDLLNPLNFASWLIYSFKDII